jgi:hypothetical protein
LLPKLAGLIIIPFLPYCSRDSSEIDTRAFDSFHGFLMEGKCDRNGLHCLRSHGFESLADQVVHFETNAHQIPVQCGQYLNLFQIPLHHHELYVQVMD